MWSRNLSRKVHIQEHFQNWPKTCIYSSWRGCCFPLRGLFWHKGLSHFSPNKMFTLERGRLKKVDPLYSDQQHGKERKIRSHDLVEGRISKWSSRYGNCFLYKGSIIFFEWAPTWSIFSVKDNFLLIPHYFRKIIFNYFFCTPYTMENISQP